MELIGHTAAGILLARLTAPQDTLPERKFYLTVCIGASILPDLDALSYLWGPDAFAAIHQRWTHTILALIVLPLLFALIFRIFHKKHSLQLIWGLSVFAFILHIAGDLIAHWPVEFFYPLSRRGWAFGLIKKDFSLTVALILIIGALVTFYDKFARHRRFISISVFIVLAIYLFAIPK